MLDRKRGARCAALTVAAALAATALRGQDRQPGQTRQPDYNFFDSRTSLRVQPAAQRGSAAVRVANLPSDATIVWHRWGGSVEQIYRLDGTLTPPSGADPETVARAFLLEQQPLLGIAGTTVFSLPLERRYESTAAGLTHLVFRQQYGGIAVFGGDVLVHVTGDGSVLRVAAGEPWPPQANPALAPALSAADAALAAIRRFDPDSRPAVQVQSPEAGPDHQAVLAIEGLREPAPARLVWFPRPGEVVLAWEIYLHLDAARWYGAVVDAVTGELLFSHNLYRDQQPKGSVFRAGDVSNPNVGPQSLENFTGWPAAAGNCPASIYPAQYRSGALLNRCWVSGTDSSGNNVVACLDATGLNQCDAKAFSSTADFEFAFTNSYALVGNATVDRSAAITNLFYWNNALHDWLYGLGFDEPSGNFQADNFGRGGFGGDPVLADAQDGSGLNNSNFATPPDGSSPRMQMFLFTNNGSFLRRDADFDGDVITHEYVHGLTTRLVGGAGNINVLPLWQSGAMGEGWSDAYACSLTNNPVIGEYISATPATGVRSVAYNNSPYTYGRFGTLYHRNIGPLSLIIDLPQVHRDGEIWATVMWDLRTALGRTTFEQVVTTALKLTPARPSMLDARNAIVQAAQAMGVGGAGQCAVWAVFAARGLGASAQLNHIQAGQANDTALSVYEAFDQPGACGGTALSPGTAVFSDDMESGVNGWIATGLWHQTSRRAASGVKSWWYGQEVTGNYNTGARTSGSLTSSAITLPAGVLAALEWDQLFSGEGFSRCYLISAGGCDPYLNYDSGWVQVSRDGGATWETLTTLAHNSDGLAFDHHKIDISRYAGNTIQLRFYFDTLDATANLGEGWYVDNVAVRRLLTGTPSLSVTPTALSFSSAAGGPNPAPQTLAVTNAGLGTLNWTTTSSSAWLSVVPASGTGSATLTVTALTGSLVPGTYNGTITVTAPGATNSPATIAVTFTVTGPAAEWRFDDPGAGGGLLVADSSGNGHSGATNGYGSVPVLGVAGAARAFNGFSDWAEMPASAAFSPASFTFRAWVKLLSYPTSAGWGAILANYGGNFQGWYVAAHSSGRVIFSVASLPSNAPWLLSVTALSLQRWYLITATYDGATGLGSIYINGALDAQAVFPGFTPQSTLPLTIDRASWFNGYYLNAAIDEARLLPLRQAAAQVLADYQSFPAPPAPPVNTAIIADWHFDDTGTTLADSTGNGRNGAINGTAITTGVLNGARSFNGLTDCARVTASDAFAPASFTARLWVKLLAYPSAAGWGVVVSNYGGNYQGWYLGVHASGRVIFSAASLPANSPWLLSNAALSLNQWYYVAATYDGATRLATIYINGIADVQAVLAGFTPAPAVDLYFGRASWFNGYSLNAAIDEARLYPAPKTAAEILSDYQSFPAPPPPPPPPVVAEWKLDDAGTALSDSSGNGHTGMAHGTTVVAGLRNSARSLNGASEWIQTPASAAFSPASFTLRAWVKLASLPAGFAALAANYGGNFQGWYLGVHSSGRIIFSVASLPSNSPWLLSNTALALNAWYHVTATYDGTSHAGTIFINGAQDVQGVFAGFSPQSALDLFVGRASWFDGYYLNAVVDEIRLLGAAQAPAEVLADYQSFP